MSARALEGNGAFLVREIHVAKNVQSALERLYQLDRVADVHGFVREAKGDEREALFVREEEGGLAIELRLPRLVPTTNGALDRAGLDALCQIIEGVSHFVYLADRANAGREATQLELELQAEVDKYVMLSEATGCQDERASEALRSRLFEDVRFTHDAATAEGTRYRVANDAANRFLRRLERTHVARRRYGELVVELRRFYRMGQAEKLRAAA